MPRLLEALGVAVEREGKQLRAPCPAAIYRHSKGADSHPSWALRDDPASERHGVHGCWSCGYGGTAVSLARDLLGLPPNDAGWTATEEWVLSHADRGEEPMPEGVVVEVAALHRAVLGVPSGVETTPLDHWPGPPRKYLQGRGIGAAEVETWRLGYGYAGRYAGRIWVPTLGEGGTLAGYTGRAFDGREPKYLDAKREDGADPTAVFGEHLWPRQGARDRVYVLEGEFNAIAVHTAASLDTRIAGEVAALGGSHAHPAHVLKVSTFREVVLLGDPDAAGEIVNEALASDLAGSCRVRVGKFRPGTDAASVTPEERMRVMRDAE